MPSEKQRKLAKKVQAAMKKKPEATIPELAEQLDSTDEEITAIIDEYEVKDGDVVHHGPGRGGGWTEQ
jgi:putative heme iron utilization protein